MPVAMFYSSFGPRPFLVECFHCLLCPPILRQHLIFVMFKYLMIGVVVLITLAISRLQPIRRPIEINQHICCFIILQHFSTSCPRKSYFPVNNKISQLSQLGGADTQISNVFSELKTKDFSPHSPQWKTFNQNLIFRWPLTEALSVQKDFILVGCKNVHAFVGRVLRKLNIVSVSPPSIYAERSSFSSSPCLLWSSPSWSLPSLGGCFWKTVVSMPHSPSWFPRELDHLLDILRGKWYLRE